MKRIWIMFLLTGLSAFVSVNNNKPRILVIGDSTVKSYKPEIRVKGWGQMIGRFFTTGVDTVMNFALSGRSTKTFINQGHWQEVLEAGRPGDYLLIQFGHNDSHDKDRPEATNADTDFKEYLRQYIREAREKGIEPVLITPMHRRLFLDDGIHVNEQYDHSLRPYATAMKAVAVEMNVPLVDLYSSSGWLYEKLGEAGCAPLACCSTDRTHFSKYGALEMARLVAQGLTQVSGKLSSYVDIYTLTAGPETGHFTPVAHRPVPEGAIAVDRPGRYARPGATYMLTRDISDPRSALFLGKDITLDLNGYTLTYADGGYAHIPNYGFEEGLKGWDISKAPGAKVVNTKDVHVFIGDKLMSLQAGDELVSGYVYLPVADRSYYAMCGMTGRYYHQGGGDKDRDMKVSIYVEDEEGKQVRCVTEYADTTMVSCPVEDKQVRLGGGFVVAHLHGLPAGKYRVRIKAVTDCLVDQIDIRPAMDVGIGIVEKTHPMGHTDHLYERAHSAFFDYTANAATGKPLAGVPVVQGAGTITIRNGIIRSGVRGVLSWGIQSTAENVKIVLENVLIKTSGINTCAVDVPAANISNCTFDVESPFIINRHGSEFYAIDLRGGECSDVSYNSFFGGQGCLSFKGMHSSIHHNLFVNRQMVTNHYSVMAMGDDSKIYNNRFEPEVGSGIEIFRHKRIEIFNNVFRIEPSPPTCEYGDQEFSTTAIRLADYGSPHGDPRGCYGNKVYNNRFYITGRDFPEYPDYVPMVWAFFYSASAGVNEIFGNEIYVHDTDPASKAETAAFYIIGGHPEGAGHFYHNRIITNVPAAWIGNRYGSARNTKIYNNIIIKSPDAGAGFKPFRIGWPGADAQDIEFRSNELVNTQFGVEMYGTTNSYTVYRTLTLQAVDKKGNVAPEVAVRILDKDGKEVYRGTTNREGKLQVELEWFHYGGDRAAYRSPYTLLAGKKKVQVELGRNVEMNLVVR